MEYDDSGPYITPNWVKERVEFLFGRSPNLDYVIYESGNRSVLLIYSDEYKLRLSYESLKAN